MDTGIEKNGNYLITWLEKENDLLLLSYQHKRTLLMYHSITAVWWYTYLINIRARGLRLTFESTIPASSDIITMKNHLSPAVINWHIKKICRPPVFNTETIIDSVMIRCESAGYFKLYSIGIICGSYQNRICIAATICSLKTPVFMDYALDVATW